MFMVGYYPIKHATFKRSHHRVLLLRSQIRPTSFKSASWTVISTYSPQPQERQRLRSLLDRLASGESSCSTDPLRQTFVWIMHRQLTKDISDSSFSFLGIKHSFLPEFGAWTTLSASWLNGATGTGSMFANASETNLLLALENGLFVHAQVADTGDGIILSALEDSSFVQSKRIWSLVSMDLARVTGPWRTKSL